MTDDEIYDVTVLISAEMTQETLDLIKQKLIKRIPDEQITNEIVFKIFGQVIQWMTMDYVDACFDDKHFDKKIEFITELCHTSKVILGLREKERYKRFDS